MFEILNSMELLPAKYKKTFINNWVTVCVLHVPLVFSQHFPRSLGRLETLRSTTRAVRQHSLNFSSKMSAQPFDAIKLS